MTPRQRLVIPPTVVHERTETVEYGVLCANGAVHVKSRQQWRLDGEAVRLDANGCGPHSDWTRLVITTAWEKAQ